MFRLLSVPLGQTRFSQYVRQFFFTTCSAFDNDWTLFTSSVLSHEVLFLYHMERNLI